MQNDANAASYGEFWVGAAKDDHSLVMFTLGTGIGCGIVVDGMIIEGRHSHGAECGHIIIEMENGRQCSCGAYGHLEGYASATALVKRAHEALDSDTKPSLLRSLKHDELTSRAISEAADAGDVLARRLMRETAHYLAVGAVSLMHTIDPDIVLFGGGMIAAGQPFLEAIRADIRAMAFPVPAAKTRIEYAQLGGEAGFIGAAGCAADRVSPARLIRLRTLHNEILDLELHLAPLVPLVDRRAEDDRTAASRPPRSRPFSARFQAMALQMWSPCLSRS